MTQHFDDIGIVNPALVFVCSGSAWCGKAWLGMARRAMARRGEARPGVLRRALARLGRVRAATQPVRHSQECRIECGTAGFGWVRPGMAWSGSVGYGAVRQV